MVWDMMLVEQVEDALRGTDNIANVIGNFKFAEGASTLGMDHTLGNAFTVEVCKQIDQVEVLQQQWAVGAYALRRLGIHNLEDLHIRSNLHVSK